jgi:hypothetical protein
MRNDPALVRALIKPTRRRLNLHLDKALASTPPSIRCFHVINGLSAGCELCEALPEPAEW